jgi:hypothetical protein
MATTKIRDIGEPIIRVEGDRVLIHIPMRFKKKSGRKEIVFADPAQVEKAVKDQVQRPLVVALARAHRWMECLEDGTFGSIAELAEVAGLDPSYVRRVLGLTMLAPDLVDMVLSGGEADAASLTSMKTDLPMSWAKQRISVYVASR